jgi:hypothetical protein
MILIRVGGLPYAAWDSLVQLEITVEEAEETFQKSSELVKQFFDQALLQLPESSLRTDIYNARKSFYQKEKYPGIKTLEYWKGLRVPALAPLIQSLEAWQLAHNQLLEFKKDYEQTLLAEYAAVQKLATDERLQRALLFSSHDLLLRLPDFIQKSPSKFDKKDRQTALSLLQYLKRALFKTSPLSRFTKLLLWRMNEEQTQDFDLEKIAVSPNVAMLPALYQLLLKNQDFRNSLSLKLNPCIAQSTPTGAGLHWLFFDGEQEAFQSIQPNAVVEKVVGFLLQNQRKQPFQVLLTQLLDWVDAPISDLEALLIELTDIGLLEWQWPENGLSSSWASNLYQYLGFLPISPTITETAFLLQTLRATAKVLPYQPVNEALNTLQDTQAQFADFFRRQQELPPPIAAAQLFYEDVACSNLVNCSNADITSLISDLSMCWMERAVVPMPPLLCRLWEYAEFSLELNQVIDFQAFFKGFTEFDQKATPKSMPRYSGKIGALLQVYRQSDQVKAVVNALFPGGGKLFARWAPLFPDAFKEAIENWNDSLQVLFPWQGWSNANFQNIQLANTLQVPDGRTKDATDGMVLCDLGVKRTKDGPILIHKTTKQQIQLLDLGLETPESRPPMLQVLWRLGMPVISSEWLYDPLEWEFMEPGLRRRLRQTWRSLTLAREAWLVEVNYFHDLFQSNRADEHFRQIRKVLKRWQVPRFFFARQLSKNEKPQFFDQNSTLSMKLFEKSWPKNGSDFLYLEEMLPVPEQWVIGEEERLSAEFVVEFQPTNPLSR